MYTCVCVFHKMESNEKSICNVCTRYLRVAQAHKAYEVKFSKNDLFLFSLLFVYAKFDFSILYKYYIKYYIIKFGMLQFMFERI